MEFLKDIHRELFENWNISRENWLVFAEVQEPQPEVKEQEEEKPEVQPTPNEKPEKRVEETKEKGNKIVKEDGEKKLDELDPKTRKKEFIQKNLPALMAKLSALKGFESLDPENPQLREVAESMLAEIDKSKLEATSGKLELSENENQKIKKALSEHIKKTLDKASKAEKGETEIISKLTDEFKLPSEKGNALNTLLALRFKAEKGETEGEFKLDGDSIKNKEQLMAAIKAKDPELAKKLTAYETAEENKDDPLKELEKYAENSVKAHEALSKMADSLGNPENLKKMGAIEGLMALLQLIPTIMDALKKGDFTIVNEMMADFNKGENPAKKLSESKKGYEEILKNKDVPLATLINIYEDPSANNQAANDLFCPGKNAEEIKTDPMGKYRLMAKPAIQAQLGRKLGLRISDVKTDEMGTKIEATRDQRKIAINFSKSEGEFVANILPYVQQKTEGGGMTWVEGERTEVKEANWDKVKNGLNATVAVKKGGKKKPAKTA